jgi:molecular chaperone GrpE
MNGPNDKIEPPPLPGQQAAEGADPAAAAAAGVEQTAADAQPDSAAEAQRLAAEVQKLEGQIKDLTDRLLRAHADLDNLRKRAEREKEETAKYAISKFAHDIVGVSDNFQRAIGAVPAGASDADPALNTLLEGVIMTEAELIKVMERHGVKRIDPVGEIFNPHMHQAMMEQIDPSVAAGTILQVFQAGYLIDSRVIRPAMVVVAKGGAKAAKPEARPANDQGQGDAGKTDSGQGAGQGEGKTAGQSG